MSQKPSDTTSSGLAIRAVYGPSDVPRGWDPGRPGESPFTRGALPGGLPDEALDDATVRGVLDGTRLEPPVPLSPRAGADGAFGRLRPADADRVTTRIIRSRGARWERWASRSPRSRTWRRSWTAIPLDSVSISMTINATASILLALLLAVARGRGTPWAKLSGTIQNDILKEYAARGTYAFPPKPSLRLVTDIFAFCTARGAALEHDLRSPATTSGRPARRPSRRSPSRSRTGSSTSGRAGAAGLSPTAIAPRLSFFFNVHNDFLRGDREVPGGPDPLGPDREGAVRDRRTRAGAALRFHTQTAGSTLTAQQPDVNVVRVAIQALAAVLGGTQSLHTNGKDEALALPTEESALLALRTQQVIAHETGVAPRRRPARRLLGGRVPDGLRSSKRRRALIERIDDMGGALAAIEAGFYQREIQEAAYRAQRAIEEKSQIVVGVNEFTRRGGEIDPDPDDRPVGRRPSRSPGLRRSVPGEIRRRRPGSGTGLVDGGP